MVARHERAIRAAAPAACPLARSWAAGNGGWGMRDGIWLGDHDVNINAGMESNVTRSELAGGRQISPT